MSPVKEIAKRVLPPQLRRKVREHLVSVGVRRLHGPNSITLADDEAAVTCVVRNGEFYVRSFIEHYTDMGFRHIFFLDNGSTDATVSVATSYPNVTVFRCTLAIEAHQGMFKRHLARRCIRGGWCLDVDIDEFFEYPFSDRIRLRDLLRYLNGRHYTAVVTQMLDMFSDQPLSELAKSDDHSLKTRYCHYDVSAIRKCRYTESEFVLHHGANNIVSDNRTELYYGGIRQTLFAYECLLTKHSLFVPGKVPDSNLFGQVHFVNGAYLADLSCVLLHYKFTTNAIDIAAQNRIHFPGTERLYRDTISVLTQFLDRTVDVSTSRKLISINDLIDNSFVFVSHDYTDFCRDIKDND